jgi:myo-inositol-1(or 4)-monophosphatase
MFPAHGIHSEEGELLNSESQYRWVVDGVDGTIDLRTGYTDHFSFCIALADMRRRRPIVGVVNAAARNGGEFYSAADGEGAFCNDEPIHVSLLENVNQVLMGVDSGKHDRAAHLPYLEKLLGPDGISCPMSTGCASVPLCLVASGVLHAYLATSLEPEDMAAAVVIIREAGGKVTNLKGDEWRLGDGSILAANPVLHYNLIQLLGI